MYAKSLQSCPTLCDLMDHSPAGSSVHEDSPVKNTGVGCHALLQGIFPTQKSNPGLLCLLYWQVSSLPLASFGKPLTTLLVYIANYDDGKGIKEVLKNIFILSVHIYAEYVLVKFVI